MGNGHYAREDDRLQNAVADAEAMKSALERLRFVVVFGTDLGQEAVEQKIKEFLRELRGCNAGLVYYSGHGLQVDGSNFIVPVDVDVQDERVLDGLVSVQGLANDVSERAENTLVFLDACRNNPFVAQVIATVASAKGLPTAETSIQQGLAMPSEPIPSSDSVGGPTYIAFAAAPGKVAWEGAGGGLSPFTEGLLKNIETTDLSLDNLTTRVRNHVHSVTKFEQDPWSLSSLKQPFYFSPGSMIWLAANSIACAALLVSILVNALIIADHPDTRFVLVGWVLLAICFILFIAGLARSVEFVRGEYDEASQGLWRRSLIGGFFGGIFAGPIVAGSYSLDWLPDPWSDDPAFGQLLAEAGLACVIAGVALGSLSFVTARMFAECRYAKGASPTAGLLAGGALGGAIAGIVVGPLLTWYFGSFSRPPVSPEVLLPGGLLSTALAVFSIVTYDVGRISYRRLRLNVLASILATSVVAAVSAAIFVAGNTVLHDLVWIALTTDHNDIGLALIGVPIGVVVGTILGTTVGVALLLVGVGESTKGWLSTFLAGR